MTRARRHAIQTASIAAGLAAWEGASRAGWLDRQFVPAPSAVWRALGEIGPDVAAVAGETLVKTLIACVLAVAGGVLAGLLLGARRHLHDVLGPFVVAAYALPKILVLPWILLVFGLGLAPSIVYGTLHGFFPVCLLVAGGVRDIDPHLVTVARALGDTPWQLYRKVVLPAVVPAALAGIRLAIVFCLLGVLVVEMFGGIRGMGFLLTGFASGFRAAELFAATAAISLLSAGGVLLLDAVDRRLGRWRE
jgi:NitT/TauT family transport system permease protein